MNKSVQNTSRRLRPWRSFYLTLLLPSLLLLAAASLLPKGQAAVAPSAPMSGDNCASATVINPAALPFVENSTTEGAGNDVDPTAQGCVEGSGLDVVYSFTPSATDVYSLGLTPTSATYDPSFYIVTDCANPAATCVTGSNGNALGKGEFLVANLNAGTRYFIVVDAATPESGAGSFHFSLRRGGPVNDTCATPKVIEASRLPFIETATTVGANNDLNPQTPCLRSRQSGNGADVIYQFVPAETQNYVVTVTPVGNYDATLYITTNCLTSDGCSAGDIGGNGFTEEIRRRLTAGTTYFIVVDGFGGDAGDFQITVIPTIANPPAAPTNLQATVISASQIDLTWEDNANNELGTRIERSLDGQNFTEVGQVGPNVTAFSDATVAASTLYFYRVLAFNNFGNSAPSNIVDATTPTPPPPPVGIIGVAPNPLDFGSVRTSATQTLTISNSGGAALQITEITDPAAPFAIVNKPALPLSIAPGQTAQLSVRFSPNAAQQFAGSFVIRSNDPANPNVTVNLRGVGTALPVPNIDISSLLVDFPGGSSSLIIEVNNTGDADLLVSSIISPASPFFVSGQPGFPTTVKPGEGFTLSVTFSPASIGVFQSQMTIVSNDPDSLLSTIHLRGTSTASSELLKLRAPAIATAAAGTMTTINVLAANGTNTDIRLSASGATQNGTFTDRGTGRGDIVLALPGDASGRRIITFRATDGANRVKTAQTVVNIVAAADTHNVQLLMTAPETASNPPTSVTANDQSITPLALTDEPVSSQSVEPQVAQGLIGYLVYRSESANVQSAAANFVGVIPASQSSFVDRVPAPANSSRVFHYRLTAFYNTGTESAASNETSTAPRILNPRFKKKALSFTAANSNVATGAVVIVDGTESFPLTRSGDLLVVSPDALSTPGGRRQKGFVKPGSQLRIRNPNGATSVTVTL